MSGDPGRLGDRLDALTARLGIAPAPDVDPADEEADRLAEQRARSLAVAEDSWRARVPARYVAAELARLDPGPVAEALAGWVVNPCRNAVLLGPTGTGKTFAAWAAVHELARRGWRWGGASVPELLDSLRPDREPLACLSAEVLLLDDLGAERATEWTGEQIGRLLDERWNREAPTIATSNLAPDRLAEWLGERAWSRLAGGALVLGVTGDDRRF